MVNNKDLTRLFRYLSGYEVEVVEKALDVNGDKTVNNKDLTHLFRYLSGYEVELCNNQSDAPDNCGASLFRMAASNIILFLTANLAESSSLISDGK